MNREFSFLAETSVGLQAYVSQDPLQLPVDYRLVFRELGLSIGLRTVERMQGLVETSLGIFEERTELCGRLAVLAR